MKNKTFTLFITVLCTLPFFIQQSFAQCHPDDYAALRALYLATDGDNWTDNSGWDVSSETPPTVCNICDWVGIECENGRVSGISLHINNLVGTIPVELSNLTNLTKLSLGDNQLTGTIPIELGNLTNLLLFHIGNNQLTGTIPIELGNLTNLVSLALSHNQLIGTIPSELGSLTKIVAFLLDNNQLTGKIPSELGNFNELTHLRLNHNQLEGCIPQSFSMFCEVNIDNLDISNNPNLYEDDLSAFCNSNSGICLENEPCHRDSLALMTLYNATNGSSWSTNTNWGINCNVCDWYGVTCNNGRVTGIRLVANNLSGTIPIEIGSLINLTNLELNNNQLVGSIPNEIGDLTNLKWLFLESNELTGTIPIELENLTNLSSLRLNNNQLGGAIPSALGSLTSLTLLTLNDNQLTGPIPKELGNLTNLDLLALDNNQLGGCIPSSFNIFCEQNVIVNISDNPNLDEQDFAAFCTDGSGICISACHPDSLALMTLYNFTNGPNWNDNTNWGTNCDICTWQGVTCNDNWRVSVLTLPNNNLNGILPAEIGQLTELVEIFLDGNSIYGSIPEELYTIPTLENIILSNNLLEGELSPSICQLSNLNEIRLAYNNISGEIPSCLDAFTNLLIINLSDNNFYGCYPDSWINYCGNDQMQFEGNTCLRIWTEFCDTGGDCSGDVYASHPDIPALLALYNATDGDNWFNNTDWGNCSPCTWHGVGCNQDGRVEGIWLTNNNLVGTIPSELDQLQSLRFLHLGENQLSGTIDPIWSLTGLWELDLTDNNLSGMIPSQIGQFRDLNRLRLGNNNFSGPIPVEFSGLFNMFWIELYNNNFSGSFPDIFQDWYQLHDIRINGNNFDGPLPTSLGFKTTLRVVEFFDNNFSGCFPFSYKNLCTNKATVFESGFSFFDNPQLPSGGDFDAFCATETGICSEDIGCEWVELEIHLGTQAVDLFYDFAIIEEGATYFINSGRYYFGTNSPNATLNYFFQLQPGTLQFRIANWANNGVDFFQLRNLSTGEVLVDNQAFTDIYSSDLFEVCPMEECPEELVWTTDFSNETVTLHATTIYANNNIVGNSNITYKAGNAINLQPGFYVEAGAEFLAIVEECPPPVQTIVIPEVEEIVSKPLVFDPRLTVYPNPFTNQTTIAYSIEKENYVNLQIVDFLGRPVSNLVKRDIESSGYHEVLFNRKQLPSGTYWVVLQSGEQVSTKKLLVLD